MDDAGGMHILEPTLSERGKSENKPDREGEAYQYLVQEILNKLLL
jgi:hypothetical protein